jgi:glucosamine--fructose-6-phosphate aminotransferase (isomerizing)
MGHGTKGAGKHTYAEIRSQADAWEGVFRRIDAEEDRLREGMRDVEEVLFTGCGSAYNISHAVSPRFQNLTGLSCRAVHASDLMINFDSYFNRNKKTLLVGYSRSGDTTETVRALQSAKEQGAQTLAIVCFGRSRMAKDAHTGLVLEEAVEKSVTTTRSLTAMVLAGYYLAAVFARKARIRGELATLPGLFRERLEYFHETGKALGTDLGIQKYAFLGHGCYYGLAREAQLKVKEMVLLPSDSHVALDFQHGPMSNVDETMLITILVSDSGRQYDLALCKNMNALGGRLLVVCDHAVLDRDQDRDGFSAYADHIVELNTGLGEGVRDVLYMPTLQFMAYYRSLAEGEDPDNPRNLLYHVELDA